MRLQLSLHAEGLKKRGSGLLNGISDPYAIVTVAGGHVPGCPEGTVLGRTETIDDCVNPDWTKIIFVDFHHGKFMPLRVSIYDDNGEKTHVLMEEAVFEVSDVLLAPGKEKSEVLRSGGSLYVHANESLEGDAIGTFRFQLRGIDIVNVEHGVLALGKSDPFFEILKKFLDAASGITRWITVYRSEPIMDNLNPYWKEALIGMEELCNGDLDCPLRVRVFDWQKKCRHRFIGEFETTVMGLVDSVSKKGNADREKAVKLFLEGQSSSTGLICVLKAEIKS